MTDTTRIIDEIRAALEKVQHSEWFMSPWHVEEDASAVRNSNDFSFIANTSSDDFAAFIATVNPLAIRSLLDHITAQAEEIERLRKENDEQFVVMSTDVVDRDGFNVEARLAWKDIILARTEAAEARVRELEGALDDVIAAEDQYVDDAGVKLSDPISDAVEAARNVLTGGRS